MTSTYLLHGVRMSSPVPLAAAESCDQAVDVAIELGELHEYDRAVGRTVVEVNDGARHFRLATASDGFLLDFPGAAAVSIGSSLRSILAAAERPDLLGSLLSGPAAVVITTLRGHSLLHASAVATKAGAVAVAGARGAGKSTIARLASGPDATLHSDDALRIDVAADGVTTFRGTTTSRLRSDVPGGIDTAGAETSADGRLLVASSTEAPATAPLAAVVTPALSPNVERVEVVPLSRKDSFRVLLSAPAIDAVGPPEWTQRHFDLAADVSRRVPCYELRVPWYAGAGADYRDAIRREVRALAGG